MVFDKPNDDPSKNDMFDSGKEDDHDLWIYSQFTCPWADTLLTLVVSPSESNVDVFVERCSTTWKRERESPDEMPYLLPSEKGKWTSLEDDIKTRSYEASFMKDSVPNIGVRLAGCLGNEAEIVPASKRILDIVSGKLGAKSLVVYE